MSRFIQTVVKDEVHRTLTILAPQKNKTLGQLVETAIEEYLEKENPTQGGQNTGRVEGKE